MNWFRIAEGRDILNQVNVTVVMSFTLQQEVKESKEQIWTRKG